MFIIRERLRQQGISARAQEIIINSWRSGTKKQYKVYLQKWELFCTEHQVSLIQPPVSAILDFLTSLFDNGLGYSALNTVRSALSSIIALSDSAHTVGNHPLVQRFIKSVFQTRPSLPCYTQTWDVKVVLNYLKTLSPAIKLNIKQLSQKLAMLCLLVTGCRSQSLLLMDVKTMVEGKSSFRFPSVKIVKQSKPGRPQPDLILPSYPVDRRLRVTTYLREYLDRTKDIRNDNSLFISYCKPHGKISSATLTRWINIIMKAAGINTDVYKTHSTRAASASAANSHSIPVDLILKTVGWSQECTFCSYYKKPVNSDSELYGRTILNTVNNE